MPPVSKTSLSYSRILRHESLLGIEDGDRGRLYAKVAPAQGSRTLAGGLATLGLALVALLLGSVGSPWFAAFLGLTGVAGGLTAGEHVTRTESRRRFRKICTRIAEAVSPGEMPEADDSIEDITANLIHNLDTRTRHERDSFISTILSLAQALEARDPYTRNHSSRVANLSVRVGKQMGLTPDRLYELHLGGMLHDIGKIGIADSILMKPGGLTKDEYEIMKGHPEVGARILDGIPGLEAVADIVLYHHEMIDGRGYPENLTGDDIPMGARIVAVADTWVSLIEDRPYRKGRPLDKARAEMYRVAGQQLDADGVTALFEMLDADQPGFPQSVSREGDGEELKKAA